MKRRRRYLADGPARRTNRCTAGAGTRSARSRTMHSPAAAATLQTNPRDALVVPLLTQVHAEREVLQCTAPPPPPPLPCRRTRDATSCRDCASPRCTKTARHQVVQKVRATRRFTEGSCSPLYFNTVYGVATKPENLEYLGIFLNIENSVNSV